jgi:hypothetical protein
MSFGAASNETWGERLSESVRKVWAVFSHLSSYFVTPGPKCASRPWPGVQELADFLRSDWIAGSSPAMTN